MRPINKIKNIPLSNITLLLIGVFFIIYSEIKNSEQKQPLNVINSDAAYYHEYIAVHIFGMKPHYPRTERKVIKYTMGMAVTYMPGVAGGYLLSEIKGIDHDFGRNNSYKRILYYMGFLYCMMGLWFLRHILKKWVNELVISIVIALLFFGTNLYFYIKVEPLMSHAPSFGFITAFVYYSLRLFEKKDLVTAIKMGLTLGLITLIRPTNIIIAIFPLVYWLTQKTSVREKINFIKTKFHLGFIIAGFMVLVFLPQMIYWHYYTGEWFYYSYRTEHFFWNKPAILQFLFSFRKGWFIYTPMMFFIIPGAIICYKKNKPIFWSILVFFLLNIYVLSSWWCWWYGGSFGMRPMIDCYGLMAIWLAIFLQEVFKKSKIGFVTMILVMGFFVYINLHQVRLARICVIHYDSMTYRAYKEVFLTEKNRRKYTGEQWEVLLDKPDYEKAKSGERFW